MMDKHLSDEPPALDELSKVIKDLDKVRPVAILVQPCPDPDCIGAAAGMGLLLKEAFGLDSVIFHTAEISHPQNQSMVNVLGLQLVRAEPAGFDPAEFSATLVVDTDLTNTGFKSEKLPSPTIRIDHHDLGNREGIALFCDVRNVGATCSIVWEYLKAYGVGLEKHSEVATALVLGTKTDTADFSTSNTTDLDYEAFRGLIPFVDRDSLAKINNYPIPKAVLEAEAIALESITQRGSVVVSSVGVINAHKRDVIPIVADRFIRIDEVNTVVILGIIGSNLIASVRSIDSRRNVQELCREVFGMEFSGAKHGGIGGARLPLGMASELVRSEAAKEIMSDEITASIAEKVFETLGES